MYRTIFLLISCLGFSFSMNGQSTSKPKYSTQISYGEKLGTIKSVADYTNKVSKEKQHLERKNFKAPKNFEGRFPRRIVDHSKQSNGPDHIIQKNSGVGGKRRNLETIVNQDGLLTDGSPSDPTGDVGKDHYVQSINGTDVAVYTKDGTLVSSFQMSIFWEQFNRRSDGDPIVLYDQEAERWIMTEFNVNNNERLMAISQTSDPLGAYDSYRFGSDLFPDYPKYSVWQDEYTVTVQDGGPGTLTVYFINREDMLNGADQVRTISTSVEGTDGSEQGFIVATPVDWSGTTRPPADRGPIVLSLADASWTTGQAEDMINVHSFEIDWEAQSAVPILTQVPVTDYNSFACAETGRQFQCIPQLGGTARDALDGLPEIITFQPHYRNFGSQESMVFNFITDVGEGDEIRAGMRWIEMRRNETADWSVYQEGTYAPDDGLHRYMGTMCIDQDGGIGMAYNTSSADDYVDLRFTGRTAGDPLGVMTFDEVVAVEGNTTVISPFGLSRFGDYSHMTVDPIDGRTFWFTGEYAADNGQTSTSRIVAFKVSRPPYDLAPTVLLQPLSSANLSNAERIEVTVKNTGSNAISDFDISYQVDNGPIVKETIYTSLEPDQSLDYTFSNTADLSTVGSYAITIITSAALDEVVANDTLRASVTKYPDTDASVSNINIEKDAVCGTDANINFSLENKGINTLNSVVVELFVNGASVDTYTHSTNLGFQEDETLTRPVTSLIDGENEIRVSVSAPNNLTDQVPDNNTTTEQINVIADGEVITIDLLTDFYQNETSFELTDNTGNIIAELDNIGPEFEETHIYTDVCLETDSCYTFTINDTANDGLTSFTTPPGSYQILRSDSSVLASIIELNFGTTESNTFCINDDCNLTADITSTDDGTLMIQVTNGRGPEFEYFVNGELLDNTNVITGLVTGEYEVIVRDLYGCEIIEQVTVTGLDAIKELSTTASAKLFPNPTDGIFTVELTGLESRATYIPITIYDIEGKLLFRTTITKFDEVYKGQVSLYYFPAGQYLVRLDLEDRAHLLQITRS